MPYVNRYTLVLYIPCSCVNGDAWSWKGPIGALDGWLGPTHHIACIQCEPHHPCPSSVPPATAPLCCPQASMPELPSAKRERYLGLGLPMYDVLILAEDVATARLFDAVLASGVAAKTASNWIMGDVMAYCNVRGRGRGAS